MRVSKKVINLLDICMVYNVHFLYALKCTHLSLALRTDYGLLPVNI